MAIRIDVDVACRASHRAAWSHPTGKPLWRNLRFQTREEELDDLWQRIPQDEDGITVVMGPTRTACVPMAACFRRHDARVVMVPPEQSADRRA